MRKPSQLLALLLAVLCAGGCTRTPAVPAAVPEGSPMGSPAMTLASAYTPAPTGAPDAAQGVTAYGAWATYWDASDGVSEIDAAGSALTDVIAFAAIFDKHDAPFLLPEAARLTRTLSILYGDTRTVYLSVVNDVETAEGVYDNKSTALLWRVLGTDAAMEAHIDALMALLQESGAEGLEIDYEAIRSDTALWTRYVSFLTKLSARTSEAGVPLRVVLEWNAAQYASFPNGPQYSVMCYNLYGTHSGPGPKADRAFLRDTFLLCRTLPGSPAMAFATGGYDWGADGNVTARTQSEAEALQLSCGVAAEDVVRDASSGALRFSYADANAVSHEVWYADAETLSLWRDLAATAGYRQVDLFRLQGNTQECLTAFFGAE